MKIGYHYQKYLSTALLAIGCVAFAFTKDYQWSQSFIGAVGLLHVILLLYYFIRKYVVIQDDVLTVNRYIPKSVNLKELTEFKVFANEYIFRSGEKEVKVDLAQMDKEGKFHLDNYLKTRGIM